jgi:hypothetical protein
MSGEGDKNNDGKVDDAELQTYLEGTKYQVQTPRHSDCPLHFLPQSMI